MAIAQATKTVSFKSPYTGTTFQHLTELIIGRDGYLSGGVASDDGVDVTVPVFAFVQRGIISEILAEVTLEIPATMLDGGELIEPAFVIAAVNDDNPTSGVTVTLTGSLEAASTAVIVAFKAGGAWQNPVPVDLTGPHQRAAELGLEEGGAAQVTVAAGEVTDIDLERGQLVDPDGVRRRLTAIATSTAKSFKLDPPIGGDVTNSRTDHIVRRRVDANLAEVRHVLGPLRGGDAAIALQTGGDMIRPHYYAKRGGILAEQWWAWSQNVPGDIRIQAGPAGEGFAATTLLTAAGGVSETWIVGQRDSDDAVILLFNDSDAGGHLNLVSFNPSTGAVVDAAIVLFAGSPQSIRAVKVTNDQFHIVYRQSSEVWYAKYSFAVASFGTAAVSPRQAAGAAEGLTALWPDVATDRYGRAHVCWISGATGVEFMRYVRIGVNGTNETAVKTFTPATDVGTTDDSVLVDPSTGAAGFVAETFTQFQSSHVVVTDHDDVYIAVLGRSTAGGVSDHLLLHHSSFEETHGFALLSMASSDGIFELGLTTAAWILFGMDFCSGELGQIVFGVIMKTGASETRHIVLTYNTEPLRNGRFEDRTLLFDENAAAITDAGNFDDIIVERGPRGGFVLLTRSGTGGSLTARTMHRGGFNRLHIDYHPKDIPLLQWEVGPDAGEALLAEDGNLAVFHPRPKKMNYPFLVGDRGDFQGHESLRKALKEASRVGGEIVIRNGIHRIDTTDVTDYLAISSGVSLRGESNTVLDFPNAIGIITTGGSRVTVGHAVAGNIVTMPSANFTATNVLPKVGDLIDLADGGSGLHVILAILAPSGTDYRFLVEDNINGAPVLGASTYHYSMGTRFENLTLRGALTGANDFLLKMIQIWQGYVRDIRIEGSMTAGATDAAVDFNNCPGLIAEGLDFVGFDADPAAFVLRVAGNGELSWGDVSTVRDARLIDGQGRIRILDSALNVHLVGCGGDGSDPAAVVFDIEVGRTTPVHLVNCTGTVDGDVAFVSTAVGKVVRAPEGVGALAFEDENTRAATIADDAIKLTAAAPNDKFNGAAEDVLTTSVNERVIRAGDTLTGRIDSRGSSMDAGHAAATPLWFLHNFAGVPSWGGDHFEDDFFFDPTDTVSMWTLDDSGSGTTTYTAPHRVLHESATTPPVGGERGGMFTKHDVLGPWSDRPFYRARMALTNGDDDDNQIEFGLIETAYRFIAGFRQNADLYGSAQVRFVLCNDSNAETAVATGLTPTDGVFYWFWIAWVSTTQAFWAITTDPFGGGLLSGTLAVGAGTIKETDLSLSSRAIYQGGGAAQCELLVDYVEGATRDRRA